MSYPYNAIPSNNPQNLTVTNPVQIIRNTRNPTAQDNPYPTGTLWQNTTTNAVWINVSSTISGAIWEPITSAGAGAILSLKGNDAIAVGPDGSGVLNLLGGNNITTTGVPGTNTESISLTGTTNHSLQVGNATGSLTSIPALTNGQLPIGSTGADPVPATLTAGTNINIVNGPGSVTINAVAGGGGTATAFYAYLSASQTNVTGDGTVYPVPYNSSLYNQNTGFNAATGIFTAPTTGIYQFSTAIDFGNIGPSHTLFQIFLVVTGTNAGTYLLSDASSAAEKDSGNLLISNAGIQAQLAGGDTAQVQVKVSGSTKTITVGGGSSTQTGYFSGSLVQNTSNSSAGVSWQRISASQTMTANNGYFVVSPGGTVVLTLPAVTNQGDSFLVNLRGATAWQVAQQAGQTIFIGNTSTTAGAGHGIQSTAAGDSVAIVCSNASTEFSVISMVGNISKF